MSASPKRTHYAERLRKALDQSGVSQAALAAAVGITQPTISYLLTKANGSKHTPGIAKALGVSAEWLADGSGDMVPGGVMPMVAEARPVFGQLRQLPLISWADALRWPAEDIQRQPGPPVWQPPGQPAHQYSDKAFALVVDSDSYGPDIPKGSTLYVEPESRQGRNGWVLVALPGQKTPTIWTAVPGLDPDRPALRNPTASQAPAQVMPEGARVIGAVAFVLST